MNVPDTDFATVDAERPTPSADVNVEELNSVSATSDLDFEDTEQDDAVFEDSGPLRPIITSTSSRRIRDLYNDYRANELDPRPSFQRGYVWDRKKASRLIESLLLNVPLPIVYTAEEDSGEEVVIDGQQRLLTFFGFIEERFPRDEKRFVLSGLKVLTDLNGLSFSQLPKDEQNRIRKYNLTVVKIASSSNPEVKFEIFERLNSGSVSLSEQELRNCIYRGSLNEVIKELSADTNFRRALNISGPMDRMRDVELVLRFLAFHERTYLNYKEGMKRFLNTYMEEFRNPSEIKLESYRNIFKQAADLSFTVFGNQAFRRYSYTRDKSGNWERAVNRALYDIVMWSFGHFDKWHIVRRKDAIRDRLISLLVYDEKFADSITTSTADLGKVKYRFDVWRNAIEEIIKMDEKTARLFSYEFRQQLFEADPTCRICSQRIEHIDDSQVDHIEQWIDGGATVPENGRLTHRFCNRSRARPGAGL